MRVQYYLVMAAFMSILFIGSCQDDPITVTSENQLRALPQQPMHPSDNPYSVEVATLGRLLFFDPILSGEKDIACSTCHHPSQGWAESLDISIGVGGQGLGNTRIEGAKGRIPRVERNAHTILNTAFNGISNNTPYDPKVAPMFWDSRTLSLEKQALGPIESFSEMRGHGFGEGLALAGVINRLSTNAEYVNLFTKAFGEGPITDEKIGKAIATFERTINANNSPFDRWYRGEVNAMSPQAIEGMNAFINTGCINCHSGPMLSDYKQHVLTVPENNKLSTVDKGDKNFGFRTPTLRNLKYTAPYMHNGVFGSLQDVLEFYDDAEGGSQNPNIPNGNRDPLLADLDMNDGQINAIIAFLNALNDDNFDKTEPVTVPSGLKVSGNVK